MSNRILRILAVIASVLTVVIGSSSFALFWDQRQASILMAHGGESTEPAIMLAPAAEEPNITLTPAAEEPNITLTPAAEEPTLPDKPTCFREYTGNLDELMSWLKKNRALVLAPDKTGTISLVCHVPDAKDDCDDQAMRLQKKALMDGYIMSVQLVENGRVMGVKVTEYLGSHMGNVVIIGNGIYYIEPEPDGNVVLITTRD